MIPDTRVFERTFRGHPYKHVGVDRMVTDPSWFSFEDESSVRDEFWDIQPGDWILDVGAAYGSYSLTALACGAERVFAWSPQGHPGSTLEAEFFRESLALNGWQDNAEIYEEGVFSKSGWLNTVSQDYSIMPPSEPNGDIIRVRRLNDWYRETFFPAYGKPDKRFWLKMDIEGAEVEALYYAMSVIGNLRPIILIENHNFKRATIEQEVRDMVTSWGYVHVGTRAYHSVSHSLYTP